MAIASGDGCLTIREAAMCHSDRPPRRRAAPPAQPAQPLPDLCPTSEAAWLCALPNLPNLFGVRAYTGEQAGRCFVSICAHTGRAGWAGWARPVTATVSSAQPHRHQVGQVGQRGPAGVVTPRRRGTAGRSGAGRPARRPGVNLNGPGRRGSLLGRFIAGSTAANFREIPWVCFGSLPSIPGNCAGSRGGA